MHISYDIKYKVKIRGDMFMSTSFRYSCQQWHKTLFCQKADRIFYPVVEANFNRWVLSSTCTSKRKRMQQFSALKLMNAFHWCRCTCSWRDCAEKNKASVDKRYKGTLRAAGRVSAGSRIHSEQVKPLTMGCGEECAEGWIISQIEMIFRIVVRELSKRIQAPGFTLTPANKKTPQS